MTFSAKMRGFMHRIWTQTQRECGKLWSLREICTPAKNPKQRINLLNWCLRTRIPLGPFFILTAQFLIAKNPIMIVFLFQSQQPFDPETGQYMPGPSSFSQVDDLTSQGSVANLADFTEAKRNSNVYHKYKFNQTPPAHLSVTQHKLKVRERHHFL